MPANTLVSTSYVANRNLSGFVEGIFNVFPYQIEPGTVVRLGLYLNGQLSGTQEHDLTGSYTDQDLSGNYKTPAVMLGGIVNGIANFSFSLLTFTVSTPPGVALAAGTTMTVTVWTSNPVWVQVDKTASVTSFETSGFLSSSLPSTIVANAGAIAPYALSVWFETSAD